VEWHDKAYPMRFKYRELSTRSVPVFDVSPSHDQGIGEQFFARKELTTSSVVKATVRVLHLDR
jgi:hypothetical protein